MVEKMKGCRQGLKNLRTEQGRPLKAKRSVHSPWREEGSLMSDREEDLGGVLPRERAYLRYSTSRVLTRPPLLVV